MNVGTRVVLLAGLAVVTAGPVLAQEAPAVGAPPAVLWIGREEVKVGRDALHEVNEAMWASAYAKLKLPAGNLAMTSLTGPPEAWFLMGYPSWEEWEKTMKAQDGNEAYSGEVKKLWAQDGDLLNRSSTIIANYRASMSYRAGSNLATRRYMQVQLVRVKPGRGREFADSWREIVAAHEKAKMDEAWAFYQVASGLPDGTYLYLQARTSLAEVDKSAPMHAAQAYAEAQGEAGRARMREMQQLAVESSQTLYFAFNPKMSTVPKAWMDADPFWAPKPVAPPKPPEKKK